KSEQCPSTRARRGLPQRWQVSITSTTSPPPGEPAKDESDPSSNPCSQPRVPGDGLLGPERFRVGGEPAVVGPPLVVVFLLGRPLRSLGHGVPPGFPDAARTASRVARGLGSPDVPRASRSAMPSVAIPSWTTDWAPGRSRSISSHSACSQTAFGPLTTPLLTAW